MPNVVVFISGKGSNLQSLIDADLPMKIVLVVCNQPNAPGLDRAQRAGIPTVCIDHRSFESREAFEQVVLESVLPHKPEWVFLAGFMRRLTPYFLNAFPNRVVNIHPSLLPKYPGLNTHQRALSDGERWVGATVHIVTEGVDAGPILEQVAVRVRDDDTVESLKERVLEAEHRLYPAVVMRLLKEGPKEAVPLCRLRVEE